MNNSLFIFFLALVISPNYGVRNQNEFEEADQAQHSHDSLHLRQRDHIHRALRYDRPNPVTHNQILEQLVDVYQRTIQPLEDAYHYNDLPERNDLSVGQIKANPLVLFLGPWSTGKTTMLNYILDTDILRTGAEPTTSEFTIVSYDEKKKSTEGVVLVSDKSKGLDALEKYGQNFLERFTGVGLPHPLLRRVTFLDTPGIIENRKQQERGYPFNKVVKWFIDRAQLILIVFDPTKLDVGLELETLFKQLKGKESQIRLILNKADSIATQELMRVYGALFWSLAPLINVTEPPRVYTGSFWPYEYKFNSNSALFKQEEASLLQDLNDVIENRLENKIALVRQHATRVRIHALLVDEYLNKLNKQWTFLDNQENVIDQLLQKPSEFNIFKGVQTKNNISPFDLPSPSVYKDFFSNNHMTNFKPLSQHCGYFSTCLMDQLDEAISTKLPALLAQANKQKHFSESRDEL